MKWCGDFMSNNIKMGLWCIGAVFIGLLCLGIEFFLWRSYIGAEIKFKTEETIVDVDERVTSKKVTDDDGYTNYEDYYYYTITWEFEDKERNKVITHKEEKESSIGSAYYVGKKRTVYVYSNDGEDYKTNSLSDSVFFRGVGIVLVLGGLGGFYYVRKKQKSLNEKEAESTSEN